MTYGQAYLSGWKETFNFSGRASRQQFWTFFLINLLIASAPLAVWCLATRLDPRYGILSFVVIPFAALWLLLMAIPCWQLAAGGCMTSAAPGSGSCWGLSFRGLRLFRWLCAACVQRRHRLAEIINHRPHSGGHMLISAHSSHRSPE
ncbi:Predicted membrane protein [Klebsiella quasipneumoniae]|nr:Predicted membrane protein [Klebsiella quasipneumoniae]